MKRMRRRVVRWALAAVGVVAAIVLALVGGVALADFQSQQGAQTAGQTLKRGVLSPDGRVAAVLRDDGAVAVTDDAGQTLALVRGHGAPVASVMFTPDGRLLTIDANGRAQLTLTAGAALRDRAHGAQAVSDFENVAWHGATKGPAEQLRRAAWMAQHGAAAKNIMDSKAVAPVLPKGVTPAPGTMFRDCTDCPQMTVVPAGRFTMGSPMSEAGRFDDEGPQREVTISAPFAVGRFEVTVGEFRRFVAATGYAPGGNCVADPEGTGSWSETPDANWSDPKFKDYRQSEADPVVCVNWADAQAYATWMSEATGETYRLLSEAEWEYAARAETTTPFWFGADENAGCGSANGADATAKAQYPDLTTSTCNDQHLYTAPAGTFDANPFGLFDMAGNAWEWVEDCYENFYSAGQPSDGSAFTKSSCSYRVDRGGSGYDSPARLRSAIRSGLTPGDRYHNLGFRLARVIEQ